MKLFSIKGHRPVNLDNVSTIFVEQDKVIFHFNNARTLRNGNIIPDYLYWEINENEQEVYKTVIVDVINENWLIPQISHQRFINLNNVSSIGFDDNKNKIIFNFNFSVSHPHYQESLIAAYEFWEFNQDVENYETNKSQLQGEI